MTRDEYRRRMGALETALETGAMRPMAVYEAAGSLGSEYRRGLYGAVVRPVALARPEPALRREVEPLSWWRRALGGLVAALVLVRDAGSGSGRGQRSPSLGGERARARRLRMLPDMDVVVKQGAYGS